MEYKRGLWHYKGFIGLTIKEVYETYQAYLGAKRFHQYINR